MSRWFSRCAPFISTVTVGTIVYLAFKDPYQASTHGQNNYFNIPGRYGRLSCFRDPQSSADCAQPLSLAQFLYVVYSYMVHSQMMLFCPQLCFALWWITKNVKEVRRRRSHEGRDGGLASPAQKGLFAPYNDSKMDIVTPGMESARSPMDMVLHAIIVPNYMEDIGTLRETLMVLASHQRAGNQYEVYLAVEEKEVDSPNKANQLIQEFEHYFLGMKATFHPYALPGEMAGKSSNVAWCARRILQDHKFRASDVVVTVMDADTHFLDDYFAEIRRLHVMYPHTNQETVYHAPVLFDRNANSSPLLVRTADLTWIWSSMSGLFPGNLISIPMSVYSLPLRLAEQVGGWDGDPTAIGEDMHMLLKCFFGTSGRLVTRSVFSAASQCNVSGNGRSLLGSACDTSAILARYHQGLRHLWGSLDSGYTIRCTLRARRILNLKHAALLHLIWQAHFMLPHFVLMLLLPQLLTFRRVVWPSSAASSHLPTTLNHAIHPALASVLATTSSMRLVSFILFNAVFFFHERLHAACVQARSHDLAAARLSCSVETRAWYRPRHLAERLAFPVVGVLFGVLPAIVAQTRHLWTERMVYVTSAKPKVLGGGGAMGAAAAAAAAVVGKVEGMEDGLLKLASRAASESDGSSSDEMAWSPTTASGRRGRWADDV